MIAILIFGLGLFHLHYFLKDLNHPSKAVLSFISSAAFLQIILAPYIFYSNFQGRDYTNLWQLNMPIDSGSYFTFAIPAVIAFSAGLRIPRMPNLRNPFLCFSEKRTSRTSMLLLIAGLCALFLQLTNWFPESLAYPIYLGIKLVPSALIALHLNFIRKSTRLVLFGFFSPYSILFFLWVVSKALQSGMFGDFMFFSFLFVILTFQSTKPNLALRIGLLLAGITLAGLIQSGKQGYRSMIWKGNQDGSIIQLLHNIQNSFAVFQDDATSEGMKISILSRVNQGFIVGHVMSHCESKNIRLNGQKTIESVSASLLPRLFWPDKPKAGGQENIKKYTPLILSGSTSMNISYFGDFYIDFGPTTGVFALFLFGLILSRSIRFVFSLGNKSLVFLIGLPAILIGTLQIETDLMMILNHLTKSLGFFFLLDTVMFHKKHIS